MHVGDVNTVSDTAFLQVGKVLSHRRLLASPGPINGRTTGTLELQQKPRRRRRRREDDDVLLLCIIIFNSIVGGVIIVFSANCIPTKEEDRDELIKDSPFCVVVFLNIRDVLLLLLCAYYNSMSSSSQITLLYNTPTTTPY